MRIAGFDPVPRHKTLAEHVYDRLRIAIMTGAVKPGERISARSVADAAKVSFTPAREAVARLITEGALELAGPKSVVVPALALKDLDEITKLRLALEGMAAEAAAANISERDLLDLEKMQRRYEKIRTNTDFAESLIVNEAFHFKIYHACGLPRVMNFIELLWLQIGPSFNLLRTQEPLSERPHDFHKDAIAGLRARDGKKVREAIQSDIGFGYERLRTLIQG
jgi:DNA-binding GntR family transcriptional regulator